MRPPKKPRHTGPRQSRPVPQAPSAPETPASPASAASPAEVEQEEPSQPIEERLAAVRKRLSQLMAARPERTPRPDKAERRRESSAPFSLSERRTEKARAKRKTWAIRIGIIAAVLAIIGGVIWALFFSHFFVLDKEKMTVEVSDPAGVISGANVYPILDPYVGEPTLAISTSTIVTELEKIPEVAAAQVSTSFPDTMTVTLTGAEPVACLIEGESCVPVTADATRLSRITPAALEALPRIDMASEGNQAAQRLGQLLDALAALPGDARANVDTAAISDTGLIEFAVGEATVKWGESTENEAKGRMLAILLQEPASLYDVSVPGAPVTRD